MERCEECRFEIDESRAQSAGAAIVEDATRVAQTLNDRAVDVVTRRQPETWSPLEYACHLRDVLIVQRERVLMARRVDRASPPMMGREERVEHDGYAEQNPADVARQLTDVARLFANVCDRLDDEDWERVVVYNGLEPPERTLRWVVADTRHELRHHLLDIQRQLA